MVQMTISTGLILVLDSSHLVVEVIKRILHSEGYATLQAKASQEAIQFLSDPSLDIKLLLAEQHIQGASGTEVALHAISSRPGIPVILTSGVPIEYWTPQDLERLEKMPCSGFSLLSKPFRSAELLGAVARMIHRSRGE